MGINQNLKYLKSSLRGQQFHSLWYSSSNFFIVPNMPCLRGYAFLVQRNPSKGFFLCVCVFKYLQSHYDFNWSFLQNYVFYVKSLDLMKTVQTASEGFGVFLCAEKLFCILIHPVSIPFQMMHQSWNTGPQFIRHLNVQSCSLLFKGHQ